MRTTLIACFVLSLVGSGCLHYQVQVRDTRRAGTSLIHLEKAGPRPPFERDGTLEFDYCDALKVGDEKPIVVESEVLERRQEAEGAIAAQLEQKAHQSPSSYLQIACLRQELSYAGSSSVPGGVVTQYERVEGRITVSTAPENLARVRRVSKGWRYFGFALALVGGTVALGALSVAAIDNNSKPWPFMVAGAGALAGGIVLYQWGPYTDVANLYPKDAAAPP